jgi:hypothetical protein
MTLIDIYIPERCQLVVDLLVLLELKHRLKHSKALWFAMLKSKVRLLVLRKLGSNEP